MPKAATAAWSASMGCPCSGRHLISSMILNLTRRCRVMSAVNRSNSRRVGRRLNRSRKEVSRKVLFATSSSMRMPRYSRTPAWPSTSLILERAAGTPANPDIKSCGMRSCPPSEILASGTAGRCFFLLYLLLRQGKERLTEFAGVDFEHRLALFEAGRQQQISRIIPQKNVIRELDERQPDVELLP